MLNPVLVKFCTDNFGATERLDYRSVSTTNTTSIKIEWYFCTDFCTFLNSLLMNLPLQTLRIISLTNRDYTLIDTFLWLVSIFLVPVRANFVHKLKAAINIHVISLIKINFNQLATPLKLAVWYMLNYLIKLIFIQLATTLNPIVI